MDPALLSRLLEFSNALVALGAAVLYTVFPPREPSGHPFISPPRWTMVQVVLFFFGLDLAYKAASPLLSVKGTSHEELTAWVGFQSVGPLWLALFLFAIRPPIPAAELFSRCVGGIE